ncbi:MAG: anthranilate synthase component I family protein [Deltaproteobacteria bacterium]|nr:anthranilate synthase component I family protein [Deltaproteobacteria bacterium]
MAYDAVNGASKVEPLSPSVSRLTPFDILEAVSTLSRPFMLSGGRYSYVGAEPFAVLTVGADETTLKWSDGRSTEKFTEAPFKLLSNLLEGFSLGDAPPFPFSSGGVGYFSYDLKGLMEDEGFTPSTKEHLGDGAALSRLPLLSIGFYNNIYVYDHEVGAAYLVETNLGKASAPSSLFRETVLTATPEAEPANIDRNEGDRYSSSISEAGYISAIKKALEYISEGDIYQINISRRLSFPLKEKPTKIYRRIKEAAPSRFAYYMDMEGFQVIANTPERFIKVKDRKVKTEPIKGTRPRRVSKAKDKSVVEELHSNIKEAAEHLMIVDLERSDMGRISKTASVKVDDFKRIETYPNLHHMVSTITGELKDGLSSIDALSQVFPGGSITGTPKVRAMELIDELEAEPRGLYTGTLGWMDFGSGNIDMAMSIRTAICVDDLIHLSVGSGIVADSDPKAEYMETTTKAEDFLNTLGLKSKATGD